MMRAATSTHEYQAVQLPLPQIMSEFLDDMQQTIPLRVE